GAAVPAGVTLDGEDRAAALLGRPLPARAKPLFWGDGRNDKFFAYPPVPEDRSPNVAVRDGHWRPLVNPDGTGAGLYDLAADPKETMDLAADKPEVAARLKAAALAWRKSVP